MVGGAIAGALRKTLGWEQLAKLMPCREIFHKRGEFAAAVERRRRLFPGIADTARAQECAWAIAGWKPRPKRLRTVKLRPGKNWLTASPLPARSVCAERMLAGRQCS